MSINTQTWVAVLDIIGLTPEDYDAILRKMGVEHTPAPGIYFHIAAPLDGGAGLRVIELWSSKDGFESFIQERLLPSAHALGLQRETTVTITPLLNAFAPRASEITALAQTRVK